MMEQAGFVSARPRRDQRSRDRCDPRPAGPLSAQEISILNTVLTAGLYDSVGRILYTSSVDVLERAVCTVETAQGKAEVHPSSVNRTLQTHGWLLFQEKVSLLLLVCGCLLVACCFLLLVLFSFSFHSYSIIFYS